MKDREPKETESFRFGLNSLFAMSGEAAIFLGSILIAATVWTTTTTLTLSAHEKLLKSQGAQLAVLVKGQEKEDAKLNAILNTMNGSSKQEQSVAKIP